MGSTRIRSDSGLVLRRSSTQNGVVYPCGTVWKAFVPLDANQLAIAKGDTIVVTERSGNYWWWGTSEKSGKSGYFPRDHLWFHTPWRRAHDDTHDRDYFVDVMTGRSVWVAPAGFIENDDITPADLKVGTDDQKGIDSHSSPASSSPHSTLPTQRRRKSKVIGTTTASPPETRAASPALPPGLFNTPREIELRNKIKQLHDENLKLRNENKRLQEQVAALQTAASTQTDARNESTSLDALAVETRHANFDPSAGTGCAQTSQDKMVSRTTSSGASANGPHQKVKPALKSKKRRATRMSMALHSGVAGSVRMSQSPHRRLSLTRRKSEKTSHARASGSSLREGNVGPRSRRNEVSAEVMKGLNNKATVDLVHTGPKKSAHVRALISDAIATNILFLNLDAVARRTCMDAFEERHAATDDNIIVQGDNGDAFYVIETGQCAVLIDNDSTGMPDIVGTLGPGGAFGELALMYNTPRNATIRAQEPVTLWRLSRSNYQAIVGLHRSLQNKRRRELFKRVSIMLTLTRSQKNNVAAVTGQETFHEYVRRFLCCCQHSCRCCVSFSSHT